MYVFFFSRINVISVNQNANKLIVFHLETYTQKIINVLKENCCECKHWIILKIFWEYLLLGNEFMQVYMKHQLFFILHETTLNCLHCYGNFVLLNPCGIVIFIIDVEESSSKNCRQVISFKYLIYLERISKILYTVKWNISEDFSEEFG